MTEISRSAITDALEKSLPEFFAGTQIDSLTGRLFRWKTLQNLRSLKRIPPEIFVKIGKNVGVLKGPFIRWAVAQIDAQPTPAQPDPTQQQRRGRGRPRKVSAPEA